MSNADPLTLHIYEYMLLQTVHNMPSHLNRNLIYTTAAHSAHAIRLTIRLHFVAHTQTVVDVLHKKPNHKPFGNGAINMHRCIIARTSLPRAAHIAPNNVVVSCDKKQTVVHSAQRTPDASHPLRARDVFKRLSLHSVQFMSKPYIHTFAALNWVLKYVRLG